MLDREDKNRIEMGGNMNENQRWAIKHKIEHKIIMQDDTVYTLATGDDWGKQYPRDLAIASNLEHYGFALEVQECICKQIKEETFSDYKLLMKDKLNREDEDKIDTCKYEALEGNPVALFEYGLFIISDVDMRFDCDDDLEDGIFWLKCSAEKGNCRAMYAIADYMESHTLIDTGLCEAWIEKYLSINPCKKDDLQSFIIPEGATINA